MEKVNTSEMLEHIQTKTKIINPLLPLEGSLLPLPIIPPGDNKGQPFDMNKILQTFDELKKRNDIIASNHDNILPHPTLIQLPGLPPRRSNM